MYEITGKVDAATAKMLDKQESEVEIVEDAEAGEYLVCRPRDGDES